MKYSFKIVAMDFWSVMGFSSEIIHDGFVPDLLRDVSSFNVFQSSEGLCHSVFDDDYRKRHKQTCHQGH